MSNRQRNKVIHRWESLAKFHPNNAPHAGKSRQRRATKAHQATIPLIHPRASASNRKSQ